MSLTLKTILSPEENKVLELKYKSRPAGELSEPELLMKGKALLLKIHVITGWTIPNSPELMNILVDQFVKTLSEKYPSLNPDEIEFAFRQHGTALEDWGKAMNLNLIDSILVPYINQRFRISEDERRIKEQQKGELVQRIFTEDELDNYAREAVQAQYKLFIRGFEIIKPEINREILLKDGLIKEPELVIDFYKRMMVNLKTDIYVQGSN